MPWLNHNQQAASPQESDTLPVQDTLKQLQEHLQATQSGNEQAGIGGGAGQVPGWSKPHLLGSGQDGLLSLTPTDQAWVSGTQTVLSAGTALNWMSQGHLVLTLIGLFPTLGSLAKGCLKILFAYGRKTVFRTAKATMDTGFWKTSKPFVEAGIRKLNEFLLRPEVRRALKAIKWYNPYRELSKLVRETAGKLNVPQLLAEFDKIIKAFGSLAEKAKQWGPASLGAQVDALVSMVINIRNMADAQLKKVLGPTADWLNKLARRLDVEADMNYRAVVDKANTHKYVRPTLMQDKVEFDLNKPEWVGKTGQAKFSELNEPPEKPLWPDISDVSKNKATIGAYQTFHEASPVIIPPGETLYRVVDPSSNDNSICWMRKAEFDKLKSKADWRRSFAVWRHWNRNGEYVTYTVPQGEGLRVWEGVTASQKLDSSSSYVLEGGASRSCSTLGSCTRRISGDACRRIGVTRIFPARLINSLACRS